MQSNSDQEATSYMIQNVVKIAYAKVRASCGFGLKHHDFGKQIYVKNWKEIVIY